MKAATTLLQMLVRLTGLSLIVVGAFLWQGGNRPWVPVHMSLGLVFVIALWSLGYIGMRLKAGSGFISSLFLWGLIVLAFGLLQNRILSGSYHWVVQALHLLAGLAAIGLAESLGARIRRSFKN